MLSTPSPPGALPQVVLLAVARLLLTTTNRIIYPFLPTFARGLDVPLAQLQQALAAAALVALLASFVAPWSERFGRRSFVVAALLLLAGGALLMWRGATFGWFALGLFTVSFAQSLYDPVMRAQIGDTIPYAWRGRAIAITEFAWSGALLLGAPLAGWLIARSGYGAPFAGLAALALVAALLLGRGLVAVRGTHGTRPTPAAMLRAFNARPVLWAAAGYVCLMMLANQVIFISYADWLEQRFGVALGALGATALLIGLAELLGEFTAGWAGDALGKRRIVMLAGLLTALACAVVPFADGARWQALLVMALLFYAFEIAFVAAVPIMTELLPQARALAMAGIALVLPLGRALGASGAGLLDALGGFVATGASAAGLTLLAVALFARFVRD